MTEQERKRIFDDWLLHYKALIFKIVRAYAYSPMDRDDLFQDIALQVWHSIPRFRGESAVTTWIYRVGLNTAIRWVKKERKHTAAGSLDFAQHILYENQESIDERLAWLYHEISKLDEIDKSVTLLLLDGLSYKEMSAILGITESNVGVKINRIKKQLMSKLKKYDHGI